MTKFTHIVCNEFTERYYFCDSYDSALAKMNTLLDELIEKESLKDINIYIAKITDHIDSTCIMVKPKHISE